MKKLTILFLTFALFNLTACTIGGLAKMKPTSHIDEIPKNLAVVNFVRPPVFRGDMVAYDIWDGEVFIGTLVAGTMIQYITDPGDHVFLVDQQHAGWGYTELKVNTGEIYYLKPNNNPFGGGPNLGIAKSDDPRIQEWKNTLSPVMVQEIKDGNIDERKKLEVHKIIQQR